MRDRHTIRHLLADISTDELKAELARRKTRCHCLRAKRHRYRSEEGDHHDLRCERYRAERFDPAVLLPPAQPRRPRSLLGALLESLDKPLTGPTPVTVSDLLGRKKPGSDDDSA